MKTNFKTDDILLTAFFLTQGIILIDILKDISQRYVFLLSDPDKCLELRRAFLNNALAPAQELFSKREMLITEIKNKNSDINFQKSQRARPLRVSGRR